MAGMNDEGRRWYVVNTYSGHENKVKENLEKRIESMGLQDTLFNIVIPEHIETEIKDGKKINKTKIMFPGYVFPMPKHEIDPILKSMGIRTTQLEINFEVGDEVKILSGPFAGKQGKVDSIDKDKENAVVLIDFLGNQTPMEVELVKLEKIEM